MFGRKSKRGASLATVLVSMAILAIVATMFTAIAMRSYQYSYAKLCKQQAYYTATSTIESYYQTIRQSSEHLSSMINALEAAYQDAVGEENGLHVDPTRVSVKVGSSGGADSSGMLVDGGFFDTYLGECELYVRYANSDRSEISIEAHATYNGYTETARAKVARTNRAASELKKIFDNVFCLQSPITTIVADAAYGDVYVSQPMVPYFFDEKGNEVTDGSEGAYNKVLADLEKYGHYNNYLAQPGQYLRDSNGTILTNGTEGQYNAVLRDYVYGNVQASTEEGGLTGHTKPLDMDNTPLYSSSALDEKDRWYNDWVELYMFSASTGGTTLDGNLYADSRVLVGLLDRNEAMREYVRYWDDTVKRSVYSKDNDSDTLTNYLQDNTDAGQGAFQVPHQRQLLLLGRRAHRELRQHSDRERPRRHKEQHLRPQRSLHRRAVHLRVAHHQSLDLFRGQHLRRCGGEGRRLHRERGYLRGYLLLRRQAHHSQQQYLRQCLLRGFGFHR